MYRPHANIVVTTIRMTGYRVTKKFLSEVAVTRVVGRRYYVKVSKYERINDLTVVP